MTINLNGVEFYSAQEVEERIREAIDGKDEKVDMENLPIGTLVKVVGNRIGHGHKVGEILPITELKEVSKVNVYRLAGRTGGWVAVDDIEFVSFPEEEESTSGDEEDPDLGFKNGDFAKVLESNIIFNEGDVIKILDVEGDGHPLAEREDGVDGYAIASSLMKIDKPSGNGDEDVSEIKAGDILIATDFELDITKGFEYEIKERETGTLYFLDDVGDIRHVSVHEEILRKKTEDTEIISGDIVIATEGELGITEGTEYEIREDLHGDLYFLDDDGDVRHVRFREDRLRKKTAKRGFKKGDIVYIKEEITDNFGDSIRPGVLTEFIEAGIGRGMRNPDGRPVLVKDGDLDKLTLVCRAEDRQDD